MNNEMRRMYEGLLTSIKSLETQADKVLGQYDKMSPKNTDAYSDERHVYSMIEGRLIEDLRDAINKMTYYLEVEPIESTLVFNSELGRYSLENWSKGSTLQSGNRLEVLNDDPEEGCKWLEGRVEYSDKYGGYYFYNNDGENFPLKAGLKVRAR